MKRKMSPITFIPLIFMILAFIVSFCTKLTMGYVIFGPLFLWAIRLNFRKPELFDGFTVGVKAAFWAYVLFMMISILTGSFCLCISLHIVGLLIIPIVSGTLSFALNFIPETEADKTKEDLTKNFGIKL